MDVRLTSARRPPCIRSRSGQQRGCSHRTRPDRRYRSCPAGQRPRPARRAAADRL